MVKVRDDLIAEIILEHKKFNDGIAPSLREIIDYYYASTNHVLSTSTIRYALINRICKQRRWRYTYQGVITNGEWYSNQGS